MKPDQVPQTPAKLHDFIMKLKDGATFTIPEMKKATGYSWHTCNKFIQNWPQRFRPSIIGRKNGLGRPFVYKLLSNGPDLKKSATVSGWDELPASRRVNALKALFPNGITVEQYGELPGIMDFLNRVSENLWYKRTESSKIS